MREWGKAMRAARQEKGLTMQELADRSGVSMWSIHDYERHNHEPRLYNLVCLAGALGVTLDEYIGRETPRQGESKELTGREKLEELICESINHECACYCNLSSPHKCFQCECIARHLLENGVTVQEDK